MKDFFIENKIKQTNLIPLPYLCVLCSAHIKRQTRNRVQSLQKSVLKHKKIPILGDLNTGHPKTNFIGILDILLSGF